MNTLTHAHYFQSTRMRRRHSVSIFVQNRVKILLTVAGPRPGRGPAVARGACKPYAYQSKYNPYQYSTLLVQCRSEPVELATRWCGETGNKVRSKVALFRLRFVWSAYLEISEIDRLDLFLPRVERELSHLRSRVWAELQYNTGCGREYLVKWNT